MLSVLRGVGAWLLDGNRYHVVLPLLHTAGAPARVWALVMAMRYQQSFSPNLVDLSVFACSPYDTWVWSQWSAAGRYNEPIAPILNGRSWLKVKADDEFKPGPLPMDLAARQQAIAMARTQAAAAAVAYALQRQREAAAAAEQQQREAAEAAAAAQKCRRDADAARKRQNRFGKQDLSRNVLCVLFSLQSRRNRFGLLMRVVSVLHINLERRRRQRKLVQRMRIVSVLYVNLGRRRKQRKFVQYMRNVSMIRGRASGRVTLTTGLIRSCFLLAP
ncbi:hypothetical protein TSOC_012617 [Tetrabaena socialis]|uniref:Uncharacterized protein n=1 Tax=Tetrabaena socialis TaxID=47790 RepID=A0A2J7ZML3_9CHLO|nr:hypothetical protein TSOC_012617 [Tetrabaena socialis]|eukprot:PNH01497.1 hypothetical protein TSOC_012617 [Tetrabaena socialis]